MELQLSLNFLNVSELSSFRFLLSGAEHDASTEGAEEPCGHVVGGELDESVAFGVLGRLKSTLLLASGAVSDYFDVLDELAWD